MIYGDNTIAQKISSNVISNPNEWSHSWAMRKPRKTKRKTISDGDGTMRSLCWDKKNSP